MLCEGKVALVTGGGRGIGKAVALELASEGADVAIWDLFIPGLEETSASIERIGRRALGMRVDVSREEDVEKGVREVVERFGRIDILVNNAGICRVGSVEEIDGDEWDEVFAVNVKGTFLCSKYVMGIMKKQGSGVIINLGSLSGKVGGIATGAHYAASKAAVMCFTKSLARELAPFGIRVNAISPGVVETDMTLGITGGNWDVYLRSIPLGRIGKAEEVAAVAAFLASDRSSYITGEIIDVNGGQLMD